VSGAGASSPARQRKLVVAALIQKDGGRGPILMSRRRADQALPLLWEFPGGKVEPGEAPEQALAREVREELGCGVAVGRIHDVVFHAYPDYDVYLLVYPCTIVEGIPSAVDVAEIAWVEPGRLPELDLLPADYPLARRLAAESA
jgi:8-oxo-dGTP diphosphatase